MFDRFSLSLMATMCLPAVLSATTYNCATYSIPGASYTSISGINNSGTLVGAYDVGYSRHGFIAEPSSGNFQTVDYPGASETQLVTINNNGAAVGEYNNAVWFTLDAAGNFSPIAAPSPYTLVRAYGINDNGGLSVLVQDDSGVPSVDILNPDGTLTPVASPAGFGNHPGDSVASVNNALQVLEVNLSDGGVWLGDAAGNVSGNILTDGFGLNNYGLVVGRIGYCYYCTSPATVVWLYVPFSRDPSGVYSEVLCPGVPISNSAVWRAVNDNGVVAGGTSIGTPLPGNPQISFSATELPFPPTQVGQTSDPQYVTLTNSGDARLDIAGTRVSNLSYGEFHVSGCLDPATQTASLDPGANCTLAVTASPAAQGTRTGTIYIDDSAAGGPHRVVVSVTGIVPPPSCQLTSIDPGPPAQANFTMQDTNSGLKGIVLVDSTNASVNIPSFSSGTKDPVNVTASQIDSSQSSQVDFQVTNVAGASSTCGAMIGGPSSHP